MDRTPYAQQPSTSTKPGLEALVALVALVAQRTREPQQALDQAHSLYDHASCGYLPLNAELRFVDINQTF
jgi:hypothetical protein